MKSRQECLSRDPKKGQRNTGTCRENVPGRGSQATTSQELSAERERSRVQERREYLRNRPGEKGRKHREESRTPFPGSSGDPLEVRNQISMRSQTDHNFSCLGTGKEEKIVGEKKSQPQKEQSEAGSSRRRLQGGKRPSEKS